MFPLLSQPIEREERRFNALRIPKKLEAALPFASKPKLQKARGNKGYAAKRAVVLEPHERRAATLMQQVHTLRKSKDAKRRAKATERREKHLKAKAAEAAKFAPMVRAERKRRYIAEGQAVASRKRQRGAK